MSENVKETYIAPDAFGIPGITDHRFARTVTPATTPTVLYNPVLKPPGSLKSKIDAIWQEFYNENMAQVSDIVNQLTMLMFIKMLDDKQSAMEAEAAIVGIALPDDECTFKSGDYTNYITRNGKREVNFTIPYADLRWKNFKNLNSHEMSRRIKNYVIPFIQDETNEAIGRFASYATKYTYAFDGKERLLQSVVDKLSDDELSFVNTDLMGDVYEYMCGTGISGQYRTPRHIIDMAVEMMEPRLGETIIDPAMGTAGFLIEAAKYVQQNESRALLTPANQAKFNSKMFYGCDTDQNMARIGYMNCVLHDIKDPNITMESLLEHDNASHLLGKFDVVLQNPPFAGSLNQDAVSAKLLTLTKTSKTELLFVTLMLELMKIGGRGMSIVPDGVLFGSSTAHKALRKELVENQKLIGVVSMPNGIFMSGTKKGSASKGAGVKTSFLIFEKTNNGGTDHVWFYNMTNDGYTLDVKRSPIQGSEIPDVIARFKNLPAEMSRSRKDKSFMVPKKEIVANDYDLTINKYREIEREVVVHRATTDIFADIEQSKADETAALADLMKLLKGE